MYFTAVAASFNGKRLRVLSLIREELFLGWKMLFLGEKRDKVWLRR